MTELRRPRLASHQQANDGECRREWNAPNYDTRVTRCIRGIRFYIYRFSKFGGYKPSYPTLNQVVMCLVDRSLELCTVQLSHRSQIVRFSGCKRLRLNMSSVWFVQSNPPLKNNSGSYCVGVPLFVITKKNVCVRQKFFEKSRNRFLHLKKDEARWSPREIPRR